MASDIPAAARPEAAQTAEQRELAALREFERAIREAHEESDDEVDEVTAIIIALRDLDRKRATP